MGMPTQKSMDAYRLVISVTLCFVLAVLIANPGTGSDQSGETSGVPQVLIARLRINWLNPTLHPEKTEFAPVAPGDFSADIFARIGDFDRSGDATSALHMLIAMRC